MKNNNQLIIYQTEDGKVKIETHFKNETVWLSIGQIAELFQRDRSVISKHIKNIFTEGELNEQLVCANFAHTTQHGAVKGLTQSKDVKNYNLDLIISVGYRVNSHQGIHFRKWATALIKEYLIKGFAMNDELLKEAGGGNYFDELLARIRDIRSSEKVFWRKVLDVYATSIDYDPKTEQSVMVFKTIQNKMHWASHGKTQPKDIRYSNGDLLVDDSKKHIEFVKSIGLKGFLITPYISYIDTNLDEIEQLHRLILPKVEFNLKRENQLFRVIKRLFAKNKPAPKWIE